MALISQEQARAHLKRDFPDADAENDLVLKMDQATAIVTHYIKRPDHGWTVNTTNDPEFLIIQAAILKVLGNLFLFRGDDDNPTGPLTPDITLMLTMFRQPTVA